MNVLVEKFFYEVSLNFEFLEDEYGYKKIEEKIENEHDFRDTAAVVRYLGKAIYVDVTWGFSGSHIGVSFVELQDGAIPAKRAFFGKAKGAAKAIDLRTLAEYLKQGDEYFLLKEDAKYSKANKRAKIIKENMSGVLEGLVLAVKNLAVNIITGDTSIFAEVISFYTDEINLRNHWRYEKDELQ